MSAKPEDLFEHLARLGIGVETHRHPAVFTVAESRGLKAEMPGAHSKNLFLKDRKGRLFLIVAAHDTQIDLKRIHETIGASGRVSFGAADLLASVLGVQPGSVTPFSVINDTESRVRVVLDATLMGHDLLNFHPLVNTATTAIGRDDLLKFLRASDHDPLVVDLPAPPVPAPELRN